MLCRAVGQLAAGIAHDFNNILTGIIGYAEMLMAEEELPYYIKKRIDMILQSGLRAANMVKQILDFSRKSVSEEAVFDLTSFLKEFLRFAQRVIPENIRIDFSTELEQCRIKADPAKIQQVFTNLVVNAKDAMPDGGNIHITLRKEYIENPSFAEMAPGDWIVIEFTDRGCGIPSDILPHIFEPFFTTKPVGHGTGLGLPQVYGIIRQHGGFIDVRSMVGCGTTFTIFLPFTAEDITATKEKPLSCPQGRGEMILIVEDNEEVRSFLVTFLTELQYRTISVSNGLEALDVYKQKKSEISLILTDLVMPEMSGLEFCKKIKQLHPDAKIIAISGYPLMSDDQKYMLECFDRIVNKPFEIKDMAVVISELLHSR
ncbi:MAG: response regulator [Nitrospirae bacterium]|nr:response regulator [Nitrospirota bacterium]